MFINDFVRLFSKHEADTIICFGIGTGLQLAFPALRVVPVYRFCKIAFRGLKSYCNYATRNLGGGNTPASLLCDALPLVDNGLDYLERQSVRFVPFAVFPRGNTVFGEERALTIPPGSSVVSEIFTIENDQSELQITRLTVSPFDPAPHQYYIVEVSYECYEVADIHVSMSIIGTDEYSDSIDCYSGPRCVLGVPGAEALIQDFISVVAEDGSARITRNVIIIF